MMYKTISLKKLLLSVAFPLAIGILASLVTGGNTAIYSDLVKPPFSPPGWLFPIVWTIMYILMGIAAYFVSFQIDARSTAMRIYYVQLAFNFLWPILFFRFEMFRTALFVLVALWVLVLLNTLMFYRLEKRAGLLLIPYLIWVTFALYLNIGIAVLN